METPELDLPKWGQAQSFARLSYINIAVTTACDLAHLLAFTRFLEVPREETRQAASAWMKSNYAPMMPDYEVYRLSHGFYLRRRAKKQGRKTLKAIGGARSRRAVKRRRAISERVYE